MTPIGEQPWYREWFGEEYLALYPHRDEEEAARAAGLFADASGLEPGGRVLDLACGAGRHLAPLAGEGYRPVGLDLSGPLLRRAREELGAGARLARGDMRRLPFRDACFGGITLFFTSFGYFEDPSDDLGTLREARRVCAGGGALLVDYLNAPRVRSTLVHEDRKTVGGRTVRQTRRIEDGFVVKRIEFEAESEDAEPRVYREKVRLYEPEELEGLVREAGFRPERRYGGYGGEAHDAGAARAIVLGRAA